MPDPSKAAPGAKVLPPDTWESGGLTIDEAMASDDWDNRLIVEPVWTSPDWRIREARALLGDVEIFREGVGAGRYVRTPRTIRQAPQESFTFQVTLSGSLASPNHMISPGQAAFDDADAPWEFESTHDYESAVISLPRQYKWMSRVPLDSVLPTLPMTRVLTATLTESLRSSDQMSPVEREALGQTVVNLLRAVADSVTQQQVVHPTGREAIRRMLIDDIERSYADLDLSPATLAARHHISLRYVHALFSEVDTSPASYIREHRLQTSRVLLRDPARAHAPLGVIAGLVGYRDDTSFVRAFRRRFDMTPTDWRRAALLSAS